MGIRVLRYVLSEAESHGFHNSARMILGGRSAVPLLEVIQDIELSAQELPRSLRSVLVRFRSLEEDHALCLTDPQFPHFLLTPTPTQYRTPHEVEMVNFVDICHLLLARLLGQYFGWHTIQDGYILNDVMPLPNRQETISSAGSAVAFDLHTEDAFHSCAGDYLGLVCLRNPDGVATSLAIAPVDELSPATVDVLFQPRFIVGANLAQTVQPITEPSAIFWGNRSRPFLRINVNSTRSIPGDYLAHFALNELIFLLRRTAALVTLQPGDFWYFDNYRVAHGRGPFEPSYNGNDRWLRRLYITSCFRKSAQYRPSPTSYTLDPQDTP